MIKENKTSNYVLYAIGEIILVMIGILLALQVNNWNEQRKNVVIEQELLKDLKIDFTETKKRLSETIQLQRAVVSNSRQLLALFESGNLLEKKDSISEFISFGALAWWRAEPVTGTFDAMLSTGNIKLLKNKKLRRVLAEFDAEIKSGFEDHENSNYLLNQLTLEQSAYSFILSNERDREMIGLAPIQDLESEEKNLITKINRLNKNERFPGLLSYKVGLDIMRLERQEKMLLFTNNILTMIEAGLEK